SLFLHVPFSSLPFYFFFDAPATTEIYTLSLHDALPIYADGIRANVYHVVAALVQPARHDALDSVHLPLDVRVAVADEQSLDVVRPKYAEELVLVVHHGVLAAHPMMEE